MHFNQMNMSIRVRNIIPIWEKINTNKYKYYKIYYVHLDYSLMVSMVFGLEYNNSKETDF